MHALHVPSFALRVVDVGRHNTFFFLLDSCYFRWSVCDNITLLAAAEQPLLSDLVLEHAVPTEGQAQQAAQVRPNSAHDIVNHSQQEFIA